MIKRYGLQLNNAHMRDTRINFDEASHTYSGQGLKSVTTIVEECFEQFDADFWSKNKASSLGMPL